jgi:undecaprenyl-phosphate galactose phosphotransferase
MKNSTQNLDISMQSSTFSVRSVAAERLPSYRSEHSTATSQYAGGRYEVANDPHARVPHETPLPPARWPEAPPARRFGKRVFDLAGSLALLVLFGPLMLALALAVRCDGGPALFGHRRIGADGQAFRCWKFRSMVPDAEAVLARTLAGDPAARAEWERDFKLRNDPRVTRLGRFLRRSSLDELPQLVNVLLGEMSLVGPRPIVTAEIARYGAAFEAYRACKPGITGLWQVSGRNDVDYAARVALDQRYADTWSLAGDFMILLRTLGVVARRSGAY